jgi:uncharacterized FAD-dependent dehydrogenase
MWLKFSQLKTELDCEESALLRLVAERLKLPITAIRNLTIRRKSLDARHKHLVFIYTLLVEIDHSGYEIASILAKHPEVTEYIPEKPQPPAIIKGSPVISQRPVIVGAGPAGLFAGLRLAAAGFRPLIIERGDGLSARIAKVEEFWTKRILDPESNIQFGVGGAGTFSDGKLTTRVKHPLIKEILAALVELGAPREIIYWQYPHIGTDLLRYVVEGLQKRIIELGGEIVYRQKLTDLRLENFRVTEIRVNHTRDIPVAVLILAVGNSARDIYDLLSRRGVYLEAKAFAVGVRIEHPQEIIDRAQYGDWAKHPKLGPAEYHLTFKHQSSGRGVYSFCMCPGGMVVGAASEPGGVVTNGMSYHARNSGVANAAIVATVTARDFGGNSALDGLRWQQELEKRAFAAGGDDFSAPAQRVADFLQQQPSVEFKRLTPSYRPGYVPANLWEVLPSGICTAIAAGIRYFGRQIKEFDWPDAVLTGVETRTSAPVKIPRNEDRECQTIRGIFPVGEGAGYAGGIISSALDGLKTAEMVIEGYNKD